MAKIQAAADGRTLTRDGKPFFWLADTCWSAFTNISDEEWEEYLDLRASQSFNVLQVNVLPQWDRCGSEHHRFPFAAEDGFKFDVGGPLDAGYFAHAASMCRVAAAKGFTPAIVVMWCNYVPGTWASAIQDFNVLPRDRVEPVVKTICETFNEFDPVYIISGDTGFDSEESIERYRLVTQLVERYAPGTAKAYHIKGRYDGLPEEFAEHADIFTRAATTAPGSSTPTRWRPVSVRGPLPGLSSTVSHATNRWATAELLTKSTFPKSFSLKVLEKGHCG